MPSIVDIHRILAFWHPRWQLRYVSTDDDDDRRGTQGDKQIFKQRPPSLLHCPICPEPQVLAPPNAKAIKEDCKQDEEFSRESLRYGKGPADRGKGNHS